MFLYTYVTSLGKWLPFSRIWVDPYYMELENIKKNWKWINAHYTHLFKRFFNNKIRLICIIWMNGSFFPFFSRTYTTHMLNHTNHRCQTQSHCLVKEYWRFYVRFRIYTSRILLLLLLLLLTIYVVECIYHISSC